MTKGASSGCAPWTNCERYESKLGEVLLLARGSGSLGHWGNDDDEEEGKWGALCIL